MKLTSQQQAAAQREIRGLFHRSNDIQRATVRALFNSTNTIAPKRIERVIRVVEDEVELMRYMLNNLRALVSST